MNFLAECCKKYDIDVALIEGALPTLVGLSVNELGRAEGEVRDKVVLALLEPNQQLAPPAECSETLKFVAENLRQLLNAARHGDYSSLPAARGKLPKSYVFNHLSRTRQRAIVLSLLAAKQLAVSTLDETPTEQIHENCYLRESFFDDWSLSKDSGELARFADSLDLLAVTWIARLEEGVNSIRDVDSLDDKAQLIASLLMTYQDLKTSASRRWRRSVEGLAERVNGNQSGSLDQRLREEALFVELVCEYQNKQTKSVDMMLIARLAKAPPKMISERAQKRYQAHREYLVSKLGQILESSYPRRAVPSLLDELQFSSYDVESYRERALKAQQREKGR